MLICLSRCVCVSEEVPARETNIFGRKLPVCLRPRASKPVYLKVLKNPKEHRKLRASKMSSSRQMQNGPALFQHLKSNGFSRMEFSYISTFNYFHINAGNSRTCRQEVAKRN